MIKFSFGLPLKESEKRLVSSNKLNTKNAIVNLMLEITSGSAYFSAVFEKIKQKPKIIFASKAQSIPIKLFLLTKFFTSQRESLSFLAQTVKQTQAFLNKR